MKTSKKLTPKQKVAKAKERRVLKEARDPTLHHMFLSYTDAVEFNKALNVFIKEPGNQALMSFLSKKLPQGVKYLHELSKKLSYSIARNKAMQATPRKLITIKIKSELAENAYHTLNGLTTDCVNYTREKMKGHSEFAFKKLEKLIEKLA